MWNTHYHDVYMYLCMYVYLCMFMCTFLYESVYRYTLERIIFHEKDQRNELFLHIVFVQIRTTIFERMQCVNSLRCCKSDSENLWKDIFFSHYHVALLIFPQIILKYTRSDWKILFLNAQCEIAGKTWIMCHNVDEYVSRQ